jgi:hypothetical protein
MKWSRQSSALLEAGNFPFKSSNFLLGTFDSVEGSFEPAHPASQALLFGFQFGPTSGQQLLATAVFGRR